LPIVAPKSRVLASDTTSPFHGLRASARAHGSAVTGGLAHCRVIHPLYLPTRRGFVILVSSKRPVWSLGGRGESQTGSPEGRAMMTKATVERDVSHRIGVQLDEETIRDLKGRLRGELLRPGDEGYDVARKVWNGAIDRYPALIVRCRGAADVVTAVRF